MLIRSPSLFFNDLRALIDRERHDHALYGADVCAAFEDYCRTREWVLARRPDWFTQPQHVVHMVQWTMGIADGGAEARMWYGHADE